MSTTTTKEKIRVLRYEAKLEKIASVHLNALDQPETQEMASKLERSSSEKLKLAETLKAFSRLDALNVYPVEMKKTVRKGENRTYVYWYASWRIDKKVKSIYIGSVAKMSRKEATIKARKLKAKDLNIDLNTHI